MTARDWKPGDRFILGGTLTGVVHTVDDYVNVWFDGHGCLTTFEPEFFTDNAAYLPSRPKAVALQCVPIADYVPDGERWVLVWDESTESWDRCSASTLHALRAHYSHVAPMPLPPEGMRS